MRIEFDKEELELIAETVHKKITPLIKSIREEVQGASNTLMSVKELQKYLNVKRDWIYQRVYNRDIPYIKMGGLLRFRKFEIDKWMRAKKP